MRNLSRLLFALLLVTTSVAILALLVMLLWRESAPPAPPATDSPPAPATEHRPPADKPPTPVYTQGDTATARALEGLDIQTMFDLDHAGALPRDARTLMALQILDGKLPRDRALSATLREHLRRTLPGPAADDVEQLLHAYRGYRREQRRQWPDSIAPDSLAAAHERLDAIEALRSEFFGESDARKLFAVDEAYSRYYLHAMAVEQDPALSREDKDARIEALRAELPDEAAELQRQPRPGQALAGEVARLRADGASEAAIQHLREQTLGIEAAEQLRHMEEQAASWEQRYQTVRDPARQILRSGLAEAEREAQFEALLAEHYSEAELPAARAYFLQREAEKERD